MTARSIILAFAVLAALSSKAADTTETGRIFHNHRIFWHETNLIGKINSKWSIQLDVQYRRQNSPPLGNPLSSPLLSSCRPFIHYNFNKDVRLSFSPAGFFMNTAYRTEGRPLQEINNEIRTTLQLQINQSAGKVSFQSRYRYELRLRQFFKSDGTLDPQYLPVNRFRLLLRATMPLKGKTIENGGIYITAFDEVLINAGKNIGTKDLQGRLVGSNNIFDQNRVFAAAGIKILNSIRIEAGPFWQLQMRPSNSRNSNYIAGGSYNSNLNPVRSEFDRAAGAQIFIFVDDVFKKRNREKETSVPPESR